VTGLDYFNARYYDPVSGQFLSADVVQGNAQGTSPYRYVMGNPESRTDPTGERMCVPTGDGGTECGNPGGGGAYCYSGDCSGGGSGSGDCNGGTKASAGMCGSDGSSNPCASGPQSGNSCRYGSGECKGLTFNGCQSWKYSEEQARQKRLAALQHEAYIELALSLGLSLLAWAVRWSETNDLLKKLEATINIALNIISFAQLVAEAFGIGGTIFQALKAVEETADLIAGTAHALIGAIKTALWFLQPALFAAASATMDAAEGPIGIVTALVTQFLGGAIGNFLGAGAGYLQMLGTMDMAEYNQQMNMPIGDWCKQNGECPQASQYTGE